MPNRRRFDEPRTFVTPDGDYPTGPFRAGTPAYAAVTAGISANLQHALTQQGMSLRKTAAKAGIAHGTLVNILAGSVVPDVGTVAALEQALNTPLYPPFTPSRDS